MSDNRFIQIARIFDNGARDRRSVAEDIGLGVTATGEILRSMIRSGILRKYTKSGPTGGRTDMFALCDDPVFSVTSVGDKAITSHIFGYSLKLLRTVTSDITEAIFLDDSLTEHIRLLKDSAPGLALGCFLCEGVPMNGYFSKASPVQLSGLPLSDIFGEVFPGVSLHLESAPLWETDDREGLTAHLCDTGSSLRLSLIYRDSVISVGGTHRSIGDITDEYGRPLASAVKFSRNTEEYVSALTKSVEAVLSFSSPDVLCISQKRYRATREIIRRIEEKLITDRGFDLASLPELVAPDHPVGDVPPHPLMLSLRERLISKISSN